MFGSTPNSVNTKVIVILQNSLQGWMAGKSRMKCIYIMFWNIKIFNNVWEKSFKVLATSCSLEVVLPFPISTILSRDLFFPEKNGLTVCQNR